jgi:AcrR family transcriptional regulator
VDARERILSTAYELFRRNGVNAVGVDRIVAEAGVAKTTLYRHFRSKDDLALAAIERHEQVWMRGWLEPEIERRANSPTERLLAIFEVFDEWFRGEEFDGCLFINCVLETHDRGSRVRAASVTAIEHVYALVQQLAMDADVRDPEGLAHGMQILMRGAIVAAVEGNSDAVQQAGAVARLLVDHERREASFRG